MFILPRYQLPPTRCHVDCQRINAGVLIVILGESLAVRSREASLVPNYIQSVARIVRVDSGAPLSYSKGLGHTDLLIYTWYCWYAIPSYIISYTHSVPVSLLEGWLLPVVDAILCVQNQIQYQNRSRSTASLIAAAVRRTASTKRSIPSWYSRLFCSCLVL